LLAPAVTVRRTSLYSRRRARARSPAPQSANSPPSPCPSCALSGATKKAHTTTTGQVGAHVTS
jgi:hypothetical protein